MFSGKTILSALICLLALNGAAARADVCSGVEGDEHYIRIRAVGTNAARFDYCETAHVDNCVRIGRRDSYPINRMQELIDLNLKKATRRDRIEAAFRAAAITLTIAAWATMRSPKVSWPTRFAAYGADGASTWMLLNQNVYMAVVEILAQGQQAPTEKWPDRCSWLERTKSKDMRDELAVTLATLEGGSGDESGASCQD